MNVKCDSSENFYNLNDQIGKTMNTYSKQELMGTARDMIMYPKQTNNYNGDLLNRYDKIIKNLIKSSKMLKLIHILLLLKLSK